MQSAVVLREFHPARVCRYDAQGVATPLYPNATAFVPFNKGAHTVMTSGLCDGAILEQEEMMLED